MKDIPVTAVQSAEVVLDEAEHEWTYEDSEGQPQTTDSPPSF